jgi:hypothetical protein
VGVERDNYDLRDVVAYSLANSEGISRRQVHFCGSLNTGHEKDGLGTSKNVGTVSYSYILGGTICSHFRPKILLQKDCFPLSLHKKIEEKVN